MSMVLIEGEYRPIGTQNDGDTLRFYPNDPNQWKLIPGSHLVRPNAHGGASIRFDAIDALETHYPSHGGGFGTVHQPLKFGHHAAQEVLHWLGFTQVQRDANETVTSAQPQKELGYILSRSADKYGRCVAFLFKGKAPNASGTSIHFGIPELHKSLNYHLIERGLVYPTYYSKLYPDIRQEITRAVGVARQAGKELWQADVTNTGFDFVSLQTIFETAVILPKLFRRLMDYLAINDGSTSLSGFLPYLAARDDRLFILSTGHSTGFDFVVDVSGQELKLKNLPEDLVFVEG